MFAFQAVEIQPKAQKPKSGSAQASGVQQSEKTRYLYVYLPDFGNSIYVDFNKIKKDYRLNSTVAGYLDNIGTNLTKWIRGWPSGDSRSPVGADTFRIDEGKFLSYAKGEIGKVTFSTNKEANEKIQEGIYNAVLTALRNSSWDSEKSNPFKKP